MVDTSGIKRAADFVAESVCLVAVFALPLYFSILTQGGYEPDKAFLLRVLALIAGAAWGMSFALDPRSGVRERGIVVLASLTVGIFVAYAFSTALSIDPRLGLWGSYTRQGGLWTRASYLVFFLVVATRFKSPRAARRLVSALLLGSLFAAVYGILQQFGYDPVPSSGDPNTLNWPVRSSFGQHVIFGSYLVMVIPFTALRVWEGRSSLQSTEGIVDAARDAVPAIVAIFVALLGFIAFLRAGIGAPGLFALYPAVLTSPVLLLIWLEGRPLTGGSARARAWGYSLLLFLQIAALLFTSARGAWLGWLASIPVFGFLLARRLDQPRVWKSILAASAALGLCLVLLNIPGGPLQPLRTLPGISRMANITDTGGAGGSAQGRILIWQGVLHLMSHQPSVGGTWNGIGRLFVGYGPESLHWAFEAVYPLKLRIVTSEIWTWDRAHNIYLDYLVDAGILGLGLFLAAMIAFFYRVLTLVRHAEGTASWLVIAGATAVAGHLVDGFFGLDMSVTTLLMWVIVGFAVNSSSDGVNDPVAELPSLDSRKVMTWIAFLAVAGLIAISISAVDHPDIMTAILLAGTLAGVTIIASSVGCVPIIRIPRPRLALVLTAVAVVASVGIATQATWEAAAMDERSGLSYLGAGDVPRSIQYLQAAALGNTREPQYRTELAAAFATLGAARGDTSEPSYVPAATDAFTINPRRASGLGQDQLFTLAEQSLVSARTLSPLDPDVHDNLGNLFTFWNKPATAIGQYRAAARLSVNNPKYLAREAMALLQEKDPSAATRRAQSALSLDTTYWYSHYALASADHASGNIAGAKNEASLALYWVHNFWPQPPQSQLSELESLSKTG